MRFLPSIFAFVCTLYLLFLTTSTPIIAQSTNGDMCFGGNTANNIGGEYYTSEKCQQQRLAKERSDCELQKIEGKVWIVFASDCVTFAEFGSVAIDYILTISSLIAGVIFIIASFKYLSSRGDPSKLADATDMLVQATIGIILIASAFVIIQVINGAFNITSSGEGINLLPFFDFP